MIRRPAFTLALMVLLSGIAAAQTSGAGGKAYGFVTHASFFSLESKQPNIVDPHVFVADSSASAGVGPQNITHVTGYRPAWRTEDPSAPLFNANGNTLKLTPAEWFGARGSVTLVPNGATTTANLTFTGLISRGRYSMFENHFSPDGVTFTPLDGTAKDNSFTAAVDGTAKFTLVIPGAVTHAEALLLVYHSDGVDHGMQRGQLGVTAHHQLIMRVP